MAGRAANRSNRGGVDLALPFAAAGPRVLPLRLGRHLRRHRLLLLLGGIPLLMAAVAPSGTVTPELVVWHTPPGVLLRGEKATVRVNLEIDPPVQTRVEGEAYVRGDPQANFTKIPLVGLAADVPSAAVVPSDLLDGSVLEDYVVVRDVMSGVSRTVPSAGANGPYRSWILDDPTTIALGKHKFGDLRAPEAIVATAKPGSRRGEVGFQCPPEGTCAEPTSFDIAADGTVWVADPTNHRLLCWDAGHPAAPSRMISFDFAPVDVAVAPDGTIYLSGVKPGDFVGLRAYAYRPNGQRLWTTALATSLFNAHVRIGPDSVPYSEDTLQGWASIVGDGQPLDPEEQLQSAQPNQPLAGGLHLVVAANPEIQGSHLAPFDWRVAIATAAGDLQHVWRITASNDLDLSLHATPTMVNGDPVVVFGVFDFENHLMEHLVLRLSPTGEIVDRLSLGRGGFRGGDVVTDIRVGPDGGLYQLESDPEWGLKIARYSLGAPTASSTPSTGPTASETVTTSPAVASPTNAPTLANSPNPGAADGASGAFSPGTWLAPLVGISILVVLGAAAFWRRRRS
jgi:hypothetical protein